MTYRALVALLLVITQLWPVAAFADCPRQDYANPKVEPDYNCPGPDEEAMVPQLQMRDSAELLKGAAAPWDGVLMDRNRVLYLGLRVKALRRVRYIERQGFAQKLEAESTFLKASSKADLDLRTSQRDSYKEQLVQTQKDLARAHAWYRSWAFGLVLGIVVTAAGTTALAYSLR